ncbi:MAG: GNAT family N-acetyltransferase [Mycobacteriales bacterium]
MSRDLTPRHPAPEMRAMREQDLTECADLHRRELPESFFARLGSRFLRAYHRTFMASPHAVALVVGSAGRTEGFLLGVLSPALHGAYVLRTWGLRLALVGSAALLVRPRELALFLRTRLPRYARGLWRRRHRHRSPADPATGSGGPEAVLTHIAVQPSVRRGGAGSTLVEGFHREVRRAEIASVVLLTEVDGPGAGFYRRLGYDEEGEVTGADGQPWLRYRRRLGNDPLPDR